MPFFIDFLFSFFAMTALFFMIIGIPLGIVMLVLGANDLEPKIKHTHIKLGIIFLGGGCLTLPLIVVIFFIFQLIYSLSGANTLPVPHVTPTPTPTPTITYQSNT